MRMSFGNAGGKSVYLSPSQRHGHKPKLLPRVEAHQTPATLLSLIEAKRNDRLRTSFPRRLPGFKLRIHQTTENQFFRGKNEPAAQRPALEARSAKPPRKERTSQEKQANAPPLA